MILNGKPDSELDASALRFKAWAQVQVCIQRVAGAESDDELAEWTGKLAEARATFASLCREREEPSN